MRRLLFLVAIVSLVVAGCGSEAEPERPPQDVAATETAGSSPSREPAAANAAADFAITTFTGERFALGEQKGTPVVLNFWESW